MTDTTELTRALRHQIWWRTTLDHTQARALAAHLIDLGWTLPAEVVGYVIGAAKPDRYGDIRLYQDEAEKDLREVRRVSVPQVLEEWAGPIKIYELREVDCG